MEYDVIVVGGGMSGLIASTYAARNGYNVLLCEKQDEVGGLVSSFPYKGFTFDGGIRAIENSGIIKPMLKQLGLKVEFLESTVSIGLQKDVIPVTGVSSVDDYGDLLKKYFPDNTTDIDAIIAVFKKSMKYMDILYGIDNPIFLDMKQDWKYMITDVVPWMFKYLFTHKKVEKMREPVDEFLATLTSNQALIDVIAQHFFLKTPTFFALSYFSLHIDYEYPKGGTGTLVDTVHEYAVSEGVQIALNTEINYVDPVGKSIRDKEGNTYQYNQLIWASDNRYLYQVLDHSLLEGNTKAQILKRQQEVEDKRGGDSVLSVYATVDLDPDYFRDKNTAHFFYTPYLTGLHDTLEKLHQLDPSDRHKVEAWIEEFFTNTTYEISIPVLRDPSLAPPRKTGLIISTLMDYDIVKEIREQGWYNEFKKLTEKHIVQVLNDTIYPELQAALIDTFSSTPLTIESRTGNTDGAITGWSFANKTMPAEERLIHIAKSVRTPIPDVLQSGQWSYSPAGLPIAILTGKMAADKAHKVLRKKR